jgi:hypothetical protein
MPWVETSVGATAAAAASTWYRLGRLGSRVSVAAMYGEILLLLLLLYIRV